MDEAVTTIGRKPFRLLNLPFYLLGNLNAILQLYAEGASSGVLDQ